MKKIKSFFFRKKKGAGHFLYPLFLFMFLAFVFYYLYCSILIEYTRNTVDDGLMAATLASACINVKDDIDFNEASTLVMNDCYDIFSISIKENMNLNSQFCPIENSACSILITSPVSIEEYTFFREYNGDIYKTTKNGVVNEKIGPVGTVKTDNGVLLTANAIYVKISFDVLNPITKETQKVTREASVDVIFDDIVVSPNP